MGNRYNHRQRHCTSQAVAGSTVRNNQASIRRKGQPALNGEMWVADGLLTVTSSDGRQKTAQVGNSRPAGLARLMLLELEEEHLHALNHPPETTE